MYWNLTKPFIAMGDIDFVFEFVMNSFVNKCMHCINVVSISSLEVTALLDVDDDDDDDLKKRVMLFNKRLIMECLSEASCLLCIDSNKLLISF